MYRKTASLEQNTNFGYFIIWSTEVLEKTDFGQFIISLSNEIENLL